MTRKVFSRNYFFKYLFKRLFTLFTPELTSGHHEPLVLIFVTRLRDTFLLFACFSHTASQVPSTWKLLALPERVTRVMTVLRQSAVLAGSKMFGRAVHLADLGFVGLNDFACTAHRDDADNLHGLSDAVRHEPRGLEGDAQDAMKLIAANALLGPLDDLFAAARRPPPDLLSRIDHVIAVYRLQASREAPMTLQVALFL